MYLQLKISDNLRSAILNGNNLACATFSCRAHPFYTPPSRLTGLYHTVKEENFAGIIFCD